MEVSIEVDREFSVIGADDRVTMGFAEAEPAAAVVLDQNLYDDVHPDVEEPSEWGEQVGDLRGAFVRLPGDQALCNVVFRFAGKPGHGTVTATGIVTLREGSHIEGTLSVTGGTGDFRNRGGEVRVKSWNPKRWTLV